MDVVENQEVCPTPQEIIREDELIQTMTGINIQNAISTCQIGGRKRRKMKGGALSKWMIKIIVIALLGVIMAYIAANSSMGIAASEMISKGITMIMNGDCITLESHFAAYQNPLCSMWQSAIFEWQSALHQIRNNPSAVVALKEQFFMIIGAMWNNKSTTAIIAGVGAGANYINGKINSLVDIIYNFQSGNIPPAASGFGSYANRGNPSGFGAIANSGTPSVFSGPAFTQMRTPQSIFGAQQNSSSSGFPYSSSSSGFGNSSSSGFSNRINPASAPPNTGSAWAPGYNSNSFRGGKNRRRTRRKGGSTKRRKRSYTRSKRR